MWWFSLITRPLPPPIFDCFQHAADVHWSNVAKVQYQLATCVDGIGTAAAASIWTPWVLLQWVARRLCLVLLLMAWFGLFWCYEPGSWHMLTGLGKFTRCKHMLDNMTMIMEGGRKPSLWQQLDEQRDLSFFFLCQGTNIQVRLMKGHSRPKGASEVSS